MDSVKRIIVNTGVQYVKAIITMCLQLYSTRLVLDALNVKDYGIYMLIAGIIALLGFITNALAITTQRYLSYYQQQENAELMDRLFVNSLFIHLFLGIIMAIGLLVVQNVLFDHVLNIEPERIVTAKSIYVISVFMLLATILTSPYKALLIAHENITYIAIIEIIDSIIKLGFAILGVLWATMILAQPRPFEIVFPIICEIDGCFFCYPMTDRGRRVFFQGNHARKSFRNFAPSTDKNVRLYGNNRKKTVCKKAGGR